MFRHFTFKHLHWRRPTTPLPPLPSPIEPLFVPTPSGNLELLYAAPQPSQEPPSQEPPSQEPPPSPSPLFFIHGGMGSASVWLEYLTFFSARGIPCYAVSMRGHGASYHPSFLGMVYATGMRELADDVLAAVRWVTEREGGREAVLVGHSSGGAVAQVLMTAGEVRVRGVVLVAATPGYGAERIAQSWRELDPWFVPRMICHLWHPNSPLSHPALTRRAFFSAEQTDAYVEAFQDRACPYESLMWAVDMMKPFVDQEKVLAQIAARDRGESVMILSAELDRIMRLPIMEDLAETYRATYSSMVREKRLRGEDAEAVPLAGEGDGDSVGHGVRYCVVPRSGHQLQNDVPWEVGARKLLAFYEQL